MTIRQPSRDRILTVKEIAAETKMCTKTVRRWIEDGRLPALRIGRNVRVERTELEVFLARQRTN